MSSLDSCAPSRSHPHPHSLTRAPDSIRRSQVHLGSTVHARRERELTASHVRGQTEEKRGEMGAPAGGFDTSKVWSPAGGWFADPKHWKRNTAMGFGVLAVASAMIFNYSRKLETRPLSPTRRIPSQAWCKNFPEDAPQK